MSSVAAVPRAEAASLAPAPVPSPGESADISRHKRKCLAVMVRARRGRIVLWAATSCAAWECGQFMRRNCCRARARRARGVTHAQRRPGGAEGASARAVVANSRRRGTARELDRRDSASGRCVRSVDASPRVWLPVERSFRRPRAPIRRTGSVRTRRRRRPRHRGAPASEPRFRGQRSS